MRYEGMLNRLSSAELEAMIDRKKREKKAEPIIRRRDAILKIVERLSKHIRALDGDAAAPGPRRAKRAMSAAARKRIAAAQKRRWAKVRALARKARRARASKPAARRAIVKRAAAPAPVRKPAPAKPNAARQAAPAKKPAAPSKPAKRPVAAKPRRLEAGLLPPVALNPLS